MLSLLVAYGVFLVILNRTLLKTHRPHVDIFQKSSYWSGIERKSAKSIAEYIKNHPPTISVNVWIEDIDQIDFIIVVQVHHSLPNLRRLIASFEDARDIGRTLLVFSHFYYKKNMEEAVRNITFTKTVQIFYPFNDHVCRNSFPGPNNHYCRFTLGCSDFVSGLRNASLSQNKHFWWWTLNFVYEQLQMKNKYVHKLMLLEDDDVVTADFLIVTDLLSELCYEVEEERCVLSLGNALDFKAESSKAIKAPFQVLKFTTGLVFNKLIYDKIKLETDTICRYDDYDWKNTLQVALIDVPAFSISSPRVVKGDEYDLYWSRNIKYLFPFQLEVERNESATVAEKNGYWSDMRDVNLCLLMHNITALYRYFEVLTPFNATK